jgi:hypothetical protein
VNTREHPCRHEPWREDHLPAFANQVPELGLLLAEILRAEHGGAEIVLELMGKGCGILWWNSG